MTSEQPTPQPKKRQRVRAFRPKRGTVNFGLPKEFDALCVSEQVSPGELLRQFIADLCDLRAWNTSSAFNSTGEPAHRAALAYHQLAKQARNAKAQTRADSADVPSPQPAAETRATTPIEALAAAVRKDRP